jgi:glucokinase
MTNLGWRFSASDLSEELGIRRIHIVNDFEAIAYSVPRLGREDLRDVGSIEHIPRRDRETVAIVGPGTGLGVGGFVRARKEFIPLAGEGGHIGFAPFDDVETEVLKQLRRRYDRVSAERILSGPGLVNLHDALSAVQGQSRESPDAHEITARALEDANSFCAQVLSRFCAILGSVVGDVALVMGARDGALLAGGILPAVADFLMGSPFRSRFEAKGRFQAYMKNIPTRLIVQDNAGLMGAASLLGQMRLLV